MKKTEKPISKEEAAQILASACQYCLKAGLLVEGSNGNDGTLTIFVNGLMLVLDNGNVLFMPVNPAH